MLRIKGFIHPSRRKGRRPSRRPSDRRPTARVGTEPAVEVLEARLAPAGLDLVGQWSNGLGSYSEVWAEGDFAYIGHLTENGVDIVNISNPADPVLASIFMGTGDNVIEDLKVINNIGYFSSPDLYDGGVYIVDLSDPYHPVQLSFITPAMGGLNGSHSISIEGDYLYQTNGSADIAVFNISDPSDPTFVRYLVSPAPVPGVHTVTPVGNYLYAAVKDPVGYVDIWDIANVGDTSEPVPLLSETVTGPYTHSAWPTPDGDDLAVSHEVEGGSVSIYNIENPADPYLVSSLPSLPADESFSSQELEITNNLMVVSWYQAGPQVWDIADPSDPLFVGSYNTYNLPVTGQEQGNWGVYVYLPNGLILASDITNGLFILSIPNISISGTVYQDTTGSGVQTAGDPGLAGATVYLDINDSGVLEAGDPTTTTNAQGEYSFSNLPPGAYLVRVVAPAGWTQTTANPASLSAANGTDITGVNFGEFQDVKVSGQVFDDLDGSGIPLAADPGLIGWTVFEDVGDQGVYEKGDPHAATGANGLFTISGIAAGDYPIRVIDQAGWLETTEAPTISPVSGTNIGGLELGEATPTISGRVDLDENSTGATSASATGLAGWTVFLDESGSGVLEPGDPTAVTNDYGYYGFMNVVPGTYFVGEVVPAGWTQTTLSPPPVVITPGGQATGLDFGDFQLATISGTVLDDSIVGNGVTAPPTPGMPGVTVFLDMNNDNVPGPYTDTLVSSAPAAPISDDGVTSSSIDVRNLAGLLSQVVVTVNLNETDDGDLGLTLVSPWGAQVTLVEAAGGNGEDFSSTIFDDLAKQAITQGTAPFDGYYRPAQPLASLNGYSPDGGWTLLADDDGADGSSGTLVSWSLTLTMADPTTTTDANGNYEFTGLPAGSYTVREVVPAGFYETTVPLGAISVRTSGTGITNQDFGNFQTVSITGTVFQDTNDDGAQEPGDPGLSGRTVYLDLNDSGSPSTITTSVASPVIPESIRAGTEARSSLLTTDLAGDINGIAVTLNIAGTVDSALSISLVSPWGTEVLLDNHQGGNGIGFSGTVIQQGASTPLSSGEAPFTGTYKSDQRLAVFDGQSPDGVWSLLIDNRAGTATGTLLSWSLEFTTSEPEAVTDENGNYTITGVPEGSFTIRERPVSGWTVTTPFPAPIVPSGGLPVTENVGNFQLGSITGNAFEDVSDSGARSAADPILAGWTVFLDENHDGIMGPAISSYTSQDTPMAIPDSPGLIAPGVGAPGILISSVQVSGLAGTITNVTVTLNISHPYDSDLRIYLISPWGRTVLLVNRAGGDHQNFTDTVLDDSATTPIADGIPPFTGTFLPQDSLSVMNGHIADGFWQLQVEDVSPDDDGTLLSWTLGLTTTEPSVTAGANGYFSLAGLPPGSYSLGVEASDGWIPTTPAPAVVTSGAHVKGVEVGVYELGIATGDVFQDATGSGALLPDDPGLSGWTVFADLDGDGVYGSYPTSFSSEDTPLAIPDSPSWGTYGVVSSAIDVEGLSGSLTAVSVTLNIAETFDADLVITLIAPSGAEVELVDQEGGSGQNFSGTTLEDAAAEPIAMGSAPFTGSYQPEEPLSTLIGGSPNGQWRLEVEDVWPGTDVAALEGWTLTLSVPEPSAVTGPGGGYTLGGLPPGRDPIEVVVPPGWSSADAGAIPALVAGSGTVIAGLNFGAYQPGTATGTVFQDMNGDGQQDPGDPGLSGMTVFADLNGDGVYGSYPTSFSSEDTPQAIPDSPSWGTYGVITSAINVEGLSGSLTGVAVTLNINETFDADLVITLIAPSGAEVELVDQEGGSGRNFIGTTLEDAAAEPIAMGSAPFAGTYQPEEPLATLAGDSPNGQWQLLIEDVWPGPDVAALEGWTLTLSVPEPSAVTGPDGSYTLSGLPPGLDAIDVVVPPGWISTTPGSVALPMTSGSVAAGVNFGLAPTFGASFVPGGPGAAFPTEGSGAVSDALADRSSAAPMPGPSDSSDATIRAIAAMTSGVGNTIALAGGLAPITRDARLFRSRLTVDAAVSSAREAIPIRGANRLDRGRGTGRTRERAPTDGALAFSVRADFPLVPEPLASHSGKRSPGGEPALNASASPPGGPAAAFDDGRSAGRSAPADGSRSRPYAWRSILGTSGGEAAHQLFRGHEEKIRGRSPGHDPS